MTTQRFALASMSPTYSLLLTELNKNNPKIIYSAAKIKIKFRDGKRHVVIKQKNDTEKSGFRDIISF
jgi:hypothetical protein